jgi:hypothetical protein
MQNEMNSFPPSGGRGHESGMGYRDDHLSGGPGDRAGWDGAGDMRGEVFHLDDEESYKSDFWWFWLMIMPALAFWGGFVVLVFWWLI